MIFVHQRGSKSECAPALYSNFFQLQPLSSKCAAPLISSLLRMHQIIFGEKKFPQTICEMCFLLPAKDQNQHYSKQLDT